MGPRRDHVQRLARRIARRAGLDTVRADFNSPLVDPSALPATVWERRPQMPGLELDLERQLGLIEHRLLPLIGDFQVPANPWYGPMDADVLFGMARSLKPSRVLELGSGYSTFKIQEALRDGSPEVVDPWPSPLLGRARDRLTVRRESASTMPRTMFDALGQDDILFVDTSHAVRPGGEVVPLVLEVLPEPQLLLERLVEAASGESRGGLKSGGDQPCCQIAVSRQALERGCEPAGVLQYDRRGAGHATARVFPATAARRSRQQQPNAQARAQQPA